LAWLDLPHSPMLLLPLTAKQSGQIPVHQPEQGIDGYGGKTLRTGRF